MLNFSNILICSENPKALAEFYQKVFDKKPDWQMEEYSGFMVGAAFISIGPHDQVHGKNSNPERILINFDTKDVKGEFERIKKAGATVVKEPYSMGEGNSTAWIATFADPDGNYFQLMTPWEDMKNS